MIPIISLDELQACPWEEALEGVPKHAHCYGPALSIWANKYVENSSQHNTFIFLSIICNMMLNIEKTGPPFKPQTVCNSGRRSPLPEDIPTENFDALFTFALTIDDHILRARIMDILWIRRIRDRISAAKEAISSYLECVRQLNFEPFECFPYMNRALSITYEMGNAGLQLRGAVIEVFEEAVQQYQAGDINGLHHNIYSLLASRKIGDQERLYALMTQTAKVHESRNNFQLMRGFLELAEIFARNANHPEDDLRKR